MAYFVRNGLVLAGVNNNNSPVALTENKTDSVKYSNTKPLSVKQEIAPIENDTVKYDVKNIEENVPNNKDKDFEAMLNRFMQTMEHRFSATIDTVKQELAVKYDKLILQRELSVKPNFTAEQEIIAKPLCKPIAFGAVINTITKGSIDNGNPRLNLKQKEELITKPIETVNTDETHQPVNSLKPSHSETKNDTEQEKETTLHQTIKEEQTNGILSEAKKIMERQEEYDDTPYKWIESKLICYIDKKYMNDKKSLVLLNPFRHWSYEKVQHIIWVNVRLSCLIESLIRLSNYSRIDTHTMLCVNDAFNKLLKSNAYKNLPDNYPYKELIAELALKINEIAIENRNETQLIFRLSVMRKAQLLTIRYQMLTNYPAVKFSELDFTEEGNPLEVVKSNDNEDDEDDDDNEKIERPKTDWRRKLRAIKREREQNKAA